MGKVTAEERRQAFQLRQVRTPLARPRLGRAQVTARPQTTQWAIVGIIGLALCMLAASAVSHAIPPIKFSASASLVEWLLPRAE